MPPQPFENPVHIRPMRASDVAELLRLMAAIVTYEGGQGFVLTEADLLRLGFGDRPEFGAFVADSGDGKLVGMAVHYEIPFMHSMRPLLMMKWLFVDANQRGRRIGQRLVEAVARHAKATGHNRFCWFVLKTNAPAQAFYRGLGATPDPQWDRWMLASEAFATLATPA
jgi:GNAT superfamily N-acetyltransferase